MEVAFPSLEAADEYPLYKEMTVMVSLLSFHSCHVKRWRDSAAH